MFSAREVFSIFNDMGDIDCEVLLPGVSSWVMPKVGAVRFDAHAHPRSLRRVEKLGADFPETRCARIKNAILSHAFMIHRDDTLYVDASIHSSAGRGAREAMIVEQFTASLNQITTPPETCYAEESALVLHNEGGGTWGHFLLQNLPKVSLYLASFPNGKIALPVQQAQIGSSPFADAIDRLGVRRDQLLPLEPSTSYRFAELVVIDSLYDFDRAFPHPFALDVLTLMGRPSEGSAEPDPIFIERVGHAPNRLIANRTDVTTQLSSHGFTNVELGSKSFGEQISAWESTRLAAGVLGSDFANIVFARPGTRVFLLSPDWFADAFFFHLAAAKGLEWNELRCGVLVDRADIEHRSSFDVDTQLMGEMLGELCDV